MVFQYIGKYFLSLNSKFNPVHKKQGAIYDSRVKKPFEIERDGVGFTRACCHNQKHFAFTAREGLIHDVYCFFLIWTRRAPFAAFKVSFGDWYDRYRFLFKAKVLDFLKVALGIESSHFLFWPMFVIPKINFFPVG